MAAVLDDPFDPAFIEGLHGLPMAEVRRRRSVADEVETGRSYLRRMVQGRLDIVAAERHRREAGQAEVGAHELVDLLPGILGDHVHAPGLGRLPSIMAPGELDPGLQARLDGIVPAHTLATLGEVPEAELARILDGLTVFEHDISTERRHLHDVLDRLQEEMVRRYRDHEVSVDDLLDAAGRATAARPAPTDGTPSDRTGPPEPGAGNGPAGRRPGGP